MEPRRYYRRVPETGRCPLHPDADSVAAISDNGYTGRQCAQCGVIFVSPRPSQSEIMQLYETGDAYLTPTHFVDRADSLADRIETQRTLAVIRRHIGQGAMLEYGPGNGSLLAATKRAGFSCFGVELNPVQAEYIRSVRGIPCVTSMDEIADLQSDRFDLIYHRDVLSHFYDPIAEFERIHRLLAPGGMHIFETGNFGDVDHRHFAHIKSFQYPDHLYFFGYRPLLELLERTGFEPVQTVRLSILPEQRLRSLMNRVRGGGASSMNDSVVQSAERETDGPPPSGVGLAARRVLDVGFLVTRRTLGRVAVDPRAPQTMTIVSRKRELGGRST